jgi:hypothetical protein
MKHVKPHNHINQVSREGGGNLGKELLFLLIAWMGKRV